MYAIISELDHSIDMMIEKLRNESTADCGRELPQMQWPYHLSWQGAEAYSLEETENRVQMIARTFAPIETRIDGFGVFTSEEPVLYLTVTRTPALSALNETLWEALRPLSKGINDYFSPDEWVPHVSILYGGPDSLPLMRCLANNLISKPLRILIRIDHLSLGYFRGQENGVIFRFPLTGEGE